MSITSQTVAPNRAASPPEIASVLLVTQASFSLVAGLSAIPFGIVEPGFRVLSLVTILIAIGMFWLARNLRRQKRWARRWVIALEALSLVVSVLLMLLPIGAMRGPVPVLVNLMMPAAVLGALLSRAGRRAFALSSAPDRTP
jgi:asparagine N-glycosylation enzyme membrane subunit Stt3